MSQRLEGPRFSPAEPGDIDIDGYMVGETWERIGICEECGSDTPVGSECCHDADVVPLT